MGTLVYHSYVLSSILRPPLWRIMTCAQGPHIAKSGPGGGHGWYIMLGPPTKIFVFSFHHEVWEFRALVLLRIGEHRVLNFNTRYKSIRSPNIFRKWISFSLINDVYQVQ